MNHRITLVYFLLAACRRDSDPPGVPAVIDPDPVDDTDAPPDSDAGGPPRATCRPRELDWREHNVPRIAFLQGGGLVWHPVTGLRSWGGGEYDGPEWQQTGLDMWPWPIERERWNVLMNAPEVCMIRRLGTLDCRSTNRDHPPAARAFGSAQDGGEFCWVKEDGGTLCEGPDDLALWPASHTFDTDTLGFWYFLDQPIDKTVYCTHNARGQVKCAYTHPQATPLEVFEDPSSCWVEFQTQATHACGISPQGHVTCVHRHSAIEPFETTDRTDLSHMSVNAHGACALDPEGYIVCWGLNNVSGPGRAVTDRPTDPGFVDVVVFDEEMACAVHESGRVACWGDERYSFITHAPDGPWTGPPQ
jgi:hypothetical protein